MSTLSVLAKLLCRPGLAGGMDSVQKYEHAFTRTIVGDEDLHALGFWRGRIALWTILRALDLTAGDEVVLPAYTCEMVPIAIKFAGAKCVYVDVEPREFNASVRSIADALTNRTRVILCQHTYGIAQAAQKLLSLATARQTTLVEDCCQMISVNSHYSGVAAAGAAAFFSTQWNKPFSTGLGGMAVFKDPQLYASARNIRTTFFHGNDNRQAWLLTLQILLHHFLARPRTQATIAAVYRQAQRLGWIRGTNTIEEYGHVMPHGYLAGATNVQAMVGLEQLRRWPENVRHRRTLTRFYLEHLPALGVDVAPIKAGSEEPILWAVPLLVENKHEILTLAAKQGLPVATWFDRIPAHINPATADRYDYRPGQCPRSEQMFPREIHLLTAPWVTPHLAERTLQFLKRFAHFSSC